MSNTSNQYSTRPSGKISSNGWQSSWAASTSSVQWPTWDPSNPYGAFTAGATQWPMQPKSSDQRDKILLMQYLSRSPEYRERIACPFCQRTVSLDSMWSHVAIEHCDRDLWSVSIGDYDNTKFPIRCVCGHVEEPNKNSFLACLDNLVEHARMSSETHRIACLMGARITKGTTNDLQESQ